MVREEFPEAVVIKPAQMFGREDRYFNHFASKIIVIKLKTSLLQKNLYMYMTLILVHNLLLQHLGLNP